MSDPPLKIGPAFANAAEIPAGGPALEATWSGRVPLLEAIEHWDPRLWRRLDDIVTPPGTCGKPRAPLVPSSGEPVPNEDRPEWLEAVTLLKQKTGMDAGYILEILDSGEPSIQPKNATDAWIETILPKEVDFANSQILRNLRVFAAWVSPGQPERAEIPEPPRRTVDKGGRRAKFHWDEFWVEVCRIANTPDGLPEQRELTKHMLEWASSNWPDSPDDSTVRAKIAALYRAPRR